MAQRHLPKFHHKIPNCNLKITEILAGSVPVKKMVDDALEVFNVFIDRTLYIGPDQLFDYDTITDRNIYDDPEIDTICQSF